MVVRIITVSRIIGAISYEGQSLYYIDYRAIRVTRIIVVVELLGS